MKIEDILTEVSNICIEVFKDPSLKITSESSANDVEEWDSISNLYLIDSIERRFGMKFSLDEIYSATNIGDLCEVIHRKIS